MSEPRIAAGVLLAAPGKGGDALSGFAAENDSFLPSMDSSRMKTSVLVVRSDQDHSMARGRSGVDAFAQPSGLVRRPGPAGRPSSGR